MNSKNKKATKDKIIYKDGKDKFYLERNLDKKINPLFWIGLFNIIMNIIILGIIIYNS